MCHLVVKAPGLVASDRHPTRLADIPALAPALEQARHDVFWLLAAAGEPIRQVDVDGQTRSRLTLGATQEVDAIGHRASLPADGHLEGQLVELVLRHRDRRARRRGVLDPSAA